MKKSTVKILTAVILTALLAFSCKSTSTSSAGTGGVSKFSDAYGKDWKLIEVRISNGEVYRNIDFDRNALIKEGFGTIFTIKIDSANISGTGAPNRYSAPYTAGEEPGTVKIAVVRSTLMAAINQPEKLKEHDFFVYIQNTHKWGLSSGKLELQSKTENGDAVIMLFGL